MKALSWFRMYTDFLSDPKMIGLAFEDQRHFIALLALKAETVLDQQCDAQLLDRIVAQRLWLDYATIMDVKKRLIGAGLIDDSWQPIAWEKRQKRSDSDPSGSERQRRFREEKQRNALRNGDGNADVTLPEKRREEKKEESARGASVVQPDGVSDDVWRDFLAGRRAKRAPLTATALAGIERESTKAGVTLEFALSKCCERGWIGFNAGWLTAPPEKKLTPAWDGAK